MKNLIWLHEEALRKNHPIFSKVDHNDVCILIWDPEYFQKMDYSFKKLVFIYETYCELPFDIYKGDILSVVNDLMIQFSLEKIYIPATPNMLLNQFIISLKEKYDVEIIEEEDFAVLEKPIKLNRFFNYWKQAERSAMKKGV